MRKLIAGLTALFLIAPGVSSAQTAYPSKPIKIVVPFPAGGVADIVARTIGTRLAENIGQTVLVENRAGASAIIGTDFVAKSAPDGYTLLLANLPVMAINPIAYTKLPYDPLKDFAPISMVTDQPYIIAINPSIPAKDLNEFIALAKQKKGEFTHGSASSSTHLASELFKIRAGIEALHVPYKGGAPAISDLMAGHAQLSFQNVNAVLSQIRAGKLRALAITSAKRSPVLPDVPTLTEAGVKNAEVYSWQAVAAPRGLPADVKAKVHGAIVEGLKDPAVAKRLTDLGFEIVANSPEQFTAFQAAEFARWKQLIDSRKITAD